MDRVEGIANGDDRRARSDRLRWRCRRGLLENDLILERFINSEGGYLSAGDERSLEVLLDLSDQALWDVLCGRVEPEPSLRPLVERLRRI